MAEAADKASKRRVYLKDVRLSFPHIAKPSSPVKDGELKYRASFIIDPNSDAGKTNLQNLKRAVAVVKEEVWGSGANPPIKADRKCIAKGDDLPDNDGNIRDGYGGMYVVRAASVDRPTALKRNKQQCPEAELGRTFYGGCRVEAIVTLYGVKGQDKGGNGIFAAFDGVRFWGDDESFGAAQVTADDFDDADDDDFGTGTAQDDDLGF